MATKPSSGRSTLDRFDSALLDFAERWAPFDGGHEFIFAEFGLTTSQFYDRLKMVLARLAPAESDPRVVSAVRHYHALHHGRP